MALVGSDNEPLRALANFALKGALWVPMTVDVNSYLNVRLPYTEAIEGRSYGYLGGSWQKNPLLLGFSSNWDENLGGIADGADYTASTSDIPADEVWMFQACSIQNATRDPAVVEMYVVRASGSYVFLKRITTPGANVPVLVTGQFLLATGDKLWLYMTGTLALDVIRAGIMGYKIDIAE